MKKALLIGVAAFLCIHTYAQSVITIQHDSTTLFANTLDSAVKVAQAGDIIYLPGGLIATVASSIAITKKLSIIGAGYHPDSSAATAITNINAYIDFNPGSEESFISGVSFGTNRGIYIRTSNITVTRTNVYDIAIQPSIGSNILIEENIVRNKILGISTSQVLSNVTVRKNLCYNDVEGKFSNITFSNNIFFKSGFVTNNCVFQNNVFVTGTYFTQANTLANNLTTDNMYYDGGGYLTGNITNQNISTVFINYVPGPWTSKQNFQLQPTCPGKNKGTDGKDIGVYGTNAPFKEGGVPFNPHFQSANIGTTTDFNGALRVVITVKAQVN